MKRWWVEWAMLAVLSGTVILALARCAGALPPAGPGAALPALPPAAPLGASAESLSLAAKFTVNHDPFRLANQPARVRFASGQRGAVGGAAARAPRPVLILTAIVGGPPWQAIVEGFPGQSGAVIVSPGARFDSMTVRAITHDVVVIQAPDTVWRLTMPRGLP